MKLLIAGNIANHSYFLVKLLRKDGIDAELLIKKNPRQTEDPLFSDDQLVDYPSWIRFWDGTKISWKLDIIRIMRKYELIQASTELPIFSQFSGRPYVTYATGADVAKLAFENSMKGRLLRRAYRKTKLLIIGAPYLYKYTTKLKIPNVVFIPVLSDYTKFNPQESLKKNNAKFTIFHPTNHVWDYKKNDRLLRAFVRVAKEKDNVHMILINRGPDFSRSIQILDNPHTINKFTVIDGTVAQSEISKFYNQADVVADQFGVGSTGLIGQEVMACGKPLLQYIDTDLYEKFYGTSPSVINARTEDEIYNALIRLINEPDTGKIMAKRAREWLLKYHNHDKIIKEYIYVYNSILNGTNFETIQEWLKNDREKWE